MAVKNFRDGFMVSPIGSGKRPSKRGGVNIGEPRLLPPTTSGASATMPADVPSPPASDLTPNDISREIQEFDRRQERRRRMVPRAALVGLLAGLTAAAFRLTLEATDRWRNALFRAAHGLPGPWGFLLVVAVCATAAGAALWLVRRFAPETAGSGIPHLKAVLHRLRGMNWRRVLWVKFASGTLGIGAGLALGR